MNASKIQMGIDQIAHGINELRMLSVCSRKTNGAFERIDRFL